MRLRSEFAVVGAMGACPFAKMTKVIKDLIARLQEEQTATEATVEFVDRSGPVHQASCRSMCCLTVRVKVARPSAGVLLFQSAALNMGASQSSGGIRNASPARRAHITLRLQEPIGRRGRQAWPQQEPDDVAEARGLSRSVLRRFVFVKTLAKVGLS